MILVKPTKTDAERNTSSYVRRDQSTVDDCMELVVLPNMLSGVLFRAELID